MHLELNQISKRFGRDTALDDISLSLPPSTLVAILGENGAGKSTLLNVIAGLLAPSAGDVLCDREVFHREKLHLRKRMLYTPDIPALFPERTVAGNVAAYVEIYGADFESRQSEVGQWMEECGAAALVDRPVGMLSRGQHWKTLLACVAAVKPEVWLVDEPFASGMDAIGMAAFRRLARHLTESGSTVIYTTQMVELAADFARHIAVLREGRLILFEKAEEVRQRLKADPDAATAILRGDPA